MPPLSSSSEWIECPDCEAPCRDVPLPPRAALICTRCGAEVRRSAISASFQAPWAFITAGIIFFVLANLQPLLTFQVAGNSQSDWVISGVWALVQQGYAPIALLVFFSAVFAPGLVLIALWYVLAACALGWRLPGAGRLFRILRFFEPWCLVSVFVAACAVASVRLAMLGEVIWQHGILWLVALAVVMVLGSQWMDRPMIAARLEELR
jgi:paraquat-inducible protein A